MDDVKVTLEFEQKGTNPTRGNLIARYGAEVIDADVLDIANEKARTVYSERIQKAHPRLDAEEVQRQLLSLLADRQRRADGKGTNTSESPDRDALLAGIPAEARKAAEAMLADPELIGRVVEDVAVLGVGGEHELVATAYLVGTSRLLDKPLAAIVQGHTSSGKSFVIKCVASLFPPEAKLMATKMTPQALYHMPTDALVHRFVVAGERAHAQNDDTADATKALREMISEGILIKQIPEKVGGEGIVTVERRVDGPIAYIESTTLARIFEEDANRCLLLATDETGAQTERVLETLARGYAGGGAGDGMQRIIDKHHAAQRMLRTTQVVIPYAWAIGRRFPSQRPEARRAYSHLMGMISASALLHCRQRLSDGQGWIVAAEEDYVLAKRLLDVPLARLLGIRISDAAMRMLDRLKGWAGRDEFTPHDVTIHETLGVRAVRGSLGELYGAGHVEQVELSRGPKPGRWRLTWIPTGGVAAGLPEPSEIFAKDREPSDNTEGVEDQGDKSAEVGCSDYLPTIPSVVGSLSEEAGSSDLCGVLTSGCALSEGVSVEEGGEDV